MLISSQRYLDHDTVQAKRESKDYTVTVSPIFYIDGVAIRVVIDGHHSLAAAKADGVTPDFVEDRINLLSKSIDEYLEASYADSDWYDVATGKVIF